MRVPLSWLQEFVPIPEDPSALADRLAMLGFGHEPLSWVNGEAVLDLETASNRPDLLGLLGVAREIAAAWEREVSFSEAALPEGGGRAKSAAQVTIDEPAWCPRYTAHVIGEVRVGPSPAEMVRRLEAVGIRSVNNVVDVTNYVMVELGQPLHAFDLDRLAGPRIVVRRARAGEDLTTLDGMARALDAATLVIADANRAVAVAGVMGGSDTEIGPSTRRVLLEAAAFDGPQVRRTARRLGLRTESSARFERGLDPRGVLAAARRAAALIAQVAGGTVLAGHIDVYPNPRAPVAIPLRLPRIARVLGVEVPEEAVLGILRRLGCRVTQRGRRLRVIAPVGRVDLQREEDLIEEVARHHGYDRIPEAMPVEAMQAGSVAPVLQAERTVRDLLIRAGLGEAVTLSLISPAALDRLGPAADDPVRRLVPVQNPLLSDHSHLRSMILPGLLEALRVNLSRRAQEGHLFEIGRTFLRFADGAGGGVGRVEERRTLGIVMWGRWVRGWNLPRDEGTVSFFDLKGVLEELCADLRVESAVEAAARPWLHPGRGARLLLGDDEVGAFGELHPEAAERCDLAGRVYVAEIDLDALLQRAVLGRRFTSLPRHPSVDRDLAVFVRVEIPQAEVLAAIRRGGGAMLEAAEVFDVYGGPQSPPGHRSLAYRLRFRAPDRTLAGEEADAILAHIQDVLREALDARPRT